MTESEKTDMLKLALAERKEFEEFEKWCTEHNPDAWMSFEEWKQQKLNEVMRDFETVWPEIK